MDEGWKSRNLFLFHWTNTNFNVQIRQIYARAAPTDATLRLWLPHRFVVTF